MSDTEAETVILTIRMTPKMRDTLNALTVTLNKSQAFMATRPGKITRATVVRECLARGVADLDQFVEGEKMWNKQMEAADM